MEYSKFLEVIANNGYSEEDAKQGGIAFLGSLRDLKSGVEEIKSGETPIGIAAGQYFYTGAGTDGVNNAILILTDERIIMADKKIKNTNFKTFFLDDVNSTAFKTQFLSAALNIKTTSGTISVDHVRKDTAKRFSDNLQELLRANKKSKKSGGALSGMDEIKKAKELLDAGIITEAEFAAVKAKHL